LCKAAGGQIRSVPSWRDQRLYGVGDGSRSMPICRNWPTAEGMVPQNIPW
jgi:hypothetical protein